jgi:hypothetical protein
VPWLHFFIFEKYENLKFWWHFKVPQANCFWANFGSFGQILLHSQWLRTCPKQGGNLKNALIHEP